LADSAITEEKIMDGAVVWTNFELGIFEMYQEAVLRLVNLESMVYRLKERCINRAALASLDATNPQQTQGKIVVQQAEDFTVFCNNPGARLFILFACYLISSLISHFLLDGKSLEDLASSLRGEQYKLQSVEHQTSRRLMSVESAGAQAVPMLAVLAVLVFAF